MPLMTIPDPNTDATAVSPGAMDTARASQLLPRCPNNFDPMATAYSTLSTGYTPVAGSLLTTLDGTKAWTYNGGANYNGWEQTHGNPTGTNDYHWPKLWYNAAGTPCAGISDTGCIWQMGDHTTIWGSHGNPFTSAFHIIGRSSPNFADGMVMEMATIDGLQLLMLNAAYGAITAWTIANYQDVPCFQHYGTLAVKAVTAQGSAKLQVWASTTNVSIAEVALDGMTIWGTGSPASGGNPTLDLRSSGYQCSLLIRNSAGYALTYLSSENGGTPLVSGAAANDSTLRCYQRLIVSVNNGVGIALKMDSAGVTIPSLAGTGSRTVKADANGLLSAP